MKNVMNLFHVRTFIKSIRGIVGQEARTVPLEPTPFISIPVTSTTTPIVTADSTPCVFNLKRFLGILFWRGAFASLFSFFCHSTRFVFFQIRHAGPDPASRKNNNASSLLDTGVKHQYDKEVELSSSLLDSVSSTE